MCAHASAARRGRVGPVLESGGPLAGQLQRRQHRHRLGRHGYRMVYICVHYLDYIFIQYRYKYEIINCIIYVYIMLYISYRYLSYILCLMIVCLTPYVIIRSNDAFL